MINKFQKGGKQQDAVMQFVKGLADTLQTDPNEFILIALLNPDALESAVLTYQLTQDMKQAAQAFIQAVLKKTLKAAHGAKLQYLKALKNKCAEDEELVYFKKGGSLDCGCKKKMETGGTTPLKPKKVELKFKEKWTLQDEKKLDSLSSLKKITPEGLREKVRLQNKFKKAFNKKDYELEEGKCGMKVKKKACGSKVEKDNCGAVVKFKAAKCGAKMKKHQLGGSLNRTILQSKGLEFFLKNNL